MRRKNQGRKPENLGVITARMQELAITGRGRAALLDMLARALAEETGISYPPA